MSPYRFDPLTVRAPSDNSSRSSALSFNPEVPRRSPEIPGVAAPGMNSNPSDPKRLVVGREISLNGEISACESLVVEGKVEANLKGCRSIEISEGGVFKGSAEIGDADIHGLFDGELNVTGILTVHPTGVVKGSVNCATLQVERGGEISGSIEVGASKS